jgi:hypothetical protein
MLSQALSIVYHNTRTVLLPPWIPATDQVARIHSSMRPWQ